MVLVKQSDKNPDDTNIAQFATMNSSGLWKFDYYRYIRHKFPNASDKDDSKIVTVCNKIYEDVLNGPDLFVCNRCGIPDTKANLDRGVEHPRYQCEEESFFFKLFCSLSRECQINPIKHYLELPDENKIKLRDIRLHSSNIAIRYQPNDWCREFIIPHYQRNNIISSEWKSYYWIAYNKLNSSKIQN